MSNNKSKKIFKCVKQGDNELLNELIHDDPTLINETNKQNSTPLLIAIDEGELECVDILLKAKADVNIVDKYQRSPLLLSALNAYDSLTVRLLDSKANPDVIDKSGDAVIHHIIRNNLQDSLYNIIKRMKNKNVLTDDKLTPLMLAVNLGHINMVQSLIDKGKVDVNYVDNQGQSAVHYCAKLLNVELLDCLCRRGGNLNLQDINGCTPLHLAFATSKAFGEQIIKKLPASRLDLTIKNNKGLTPPNCTKDLLLSNNVDDDLDDSDDMNNDDDDERKKKHKNKAKLNVELEKFLNQNNLQHLNEAFARKKIDLNDLIGIVEVNKLNKLNIGTYSDHEAIKEAVTQLKQKEADDLAAELAGAEFEQIVKQRKTTQLRIFFVSLLVIGFAIIYAYIEMKSNNDTTTT